MMLPEKNADAPEIADPPFTAASAEGLLIGVPVGVVLLVVGGALRVHINTFAMMLLGSIGAGVLSGIALSQPRLLERLGALQRTFLEILILLAYASMVCFGLLKVFVEGRPD